MVDKLVVSLDRGHFAKSDPTGGTEVSAASDVCPGTVDRDLVRIIDYTGLCSTISQRDSLLTRHFQKRGPSNRDTFPQLLA